MEANPMLTDTQVCINCQNIAKPNELYCPHCGYILPYALNDLSRTVSFGELDRRTADLQWGTGFFHQQARLYLHLEEAREQGYLDVIEIPLERLSATLGRGVADDEVKVDLTPLGALALGISRRHARIDLLRDVLRVTDLGSVNGTFLNRVRLVPNTSYTLRNRAVLQLGNMVMRVQFM